MNRGLANNRILREENERVKEGAITTQRTVLLKLLETIKSKHLKF
jgi:hypothetical protein